MNQTTTLHETAFTIKGNEPFIKYGESGIIVHLKGPWGQTHVLVERYLSGVSGLVNFQKGDTIRLRLDRVRKVGWFKEIFRRIFG